MLFRQGLYINCFDKHNNESQWEMTVGSKSVIQDNDIIQTFIIKN